MAALEESEGPMTTLTPAPPSPPPASTLLLHQLRMGVVMAKAKANLPRHEWAEFVAGLGSYATEQLGQLCTTTNARSQQ